MNLLQEMVFCERKSLRQPAPLFMRFLKRRKDGMESHVVTEGSAFYEIDDTCMRERKQRQEKAITEDRRKTKEKRVQQRDGGEGEKSGS